MWKEKWSFHVNFCASLHIGGIDAHREGGGGVWNSTPPPRQIFEKLVNKNAIKRKIGVPPETLDPPPPLGILAKTSRNPSPGFSTRVHLWLEVKAGVNRCVKQATKKHHFIISNFFLTSLNCYFITSMSLLVVWEQNLVTHKRITRTNI